MMKGPLSEPFKSTLDRFNPQRFTASSLFLSLSPVLYQTPDVLHSLKSLCFLLKDV
jgi:hypothetical protein